MTRNQDARPFVDLLKDADEFKAKFDDDIKRCIEYLDEKITALIRDPDSLGNLKRGANSNPLVEFSKAKYEIFLGARSLMTEMEREWLKYISEMKKLFVENVEIFLAGTKLEVKLPTSEFRSSPGFKKSPRKQEQSSITSSIYPIINSFAKNVAALSSPLRSKDSLKQKQSPKNTLNDFQVSNSDETSEDEPARTGRKSLHLTPSMKPTVRISKREESAAKDIKSKTPSSKSRGTKEKSSSSDLDMSISKSRSRETKVDNSPDLNRSRSSSGARSGLLKELKSDSPALNRSRSSSGTRNGLKNDVKNLSSSPGLNRSRLSSGARGGLKNELKSLSESPALNRSRSSSGARGASKNEVKMMSDSPGLNRSRSSSGNRGGNKEVAKLNMSATAKFSISDIDKKQASSKSPGLPSELKKLCDSPGFQEASQLNSRSSRHNSGRKSSSSSAERFKKTIETTETEIEEDSSDSKREERKGQQRKKSGKSFKRKDVSVERPKTTEEEKETDIEIEESTTSRTGKERKGRQTAKVVNTKAAQQKKEEINETETEDEPSDSKKADKGHKGRKSVKSTKQEKDNATQLKKEKEANETETEDEPSDFKTVDRRYKGRKSVKSTKQEKASETRDASSKKAVDKAAKSQSKSGKSEAKIPNDSEETSEAEQIKDINESLAKTRKGRASTRSNPAKLTETKVASRTPAKTNRKTTRDDTPDSIPSPPKKARHSTKQEANSPAKPKTSSTEESEISDTEQSKVSTKGKRGKQTAKNKSNDSSVSSKTPGRASRKAAAEVIPQTGASKSPKKVTFTKEQVYDDLDVFTPAKGSKAALRRKTLLPNLADISDSELGNPIRAKGKRKTIGGVSDLNAVTPPKRLKDSGNKKRVSSSQDEEDADDNLLENDGNYTHWIPLKSVDAKIPTCPGIYEVKVSRAKKSAYIGCCDSLRQKLTLYKLRQKSGHKHLDNFIDRNLNDIQIRYEVVPSMNDAKTEVKNRINTFVAQYKTTPAYN